MANGTCDVWVEPIDRDLVVGDSVRCHAIFRLMTGAVTDPTTIVAKHEDPSGTETTPTATKTTAGRYYFDLTIDEAGTWSFQFVGTGDIVAAGEATFTVESTVF